MVLSGEAMVPRPLSSPRVETKTALVASPSIPSQLESVKERSGSSPMTQTGPASGPASEPASAVTPPSGAGGVVFAGDEQAASAANERSERRRIAAVYAG